MFANYSIHDASNSTYTKFNKSHDVNTALIKAIKDILKRDWIVQVNHIFREANFAADCLALEAQTAPLGCHRLQHMPVCFKDWIEHDCIRVAHEQLVRY